MGVSEVGVSDILAQFVAMQNREYCRLHLCLNMRVLRSGLHLRVRIMYTYILFEFESSAGSLNH